MIKKLARCVGEFRRQTILTPIFMVCEVLMECLIPFIIAQLVNCIKAGGEFRDIASYGLLLFVILVATNRTVGGRSRYLYPLIPFDLKALARLFFRVKKENGDE